MSQESRDSFPKPNNRDLIHEPGFSTGSKDDEEKTASQESDGLWNEFMRDIDREKSKASNSSVARRSTGGLGSLTSVIKKEKKQSPHPKRLNNGSPLPPMKKVSNDLFDLSTEFIPSKEKKKPSGNRNRTLEEVQSSSSSSKFVPITKTEDHVSDSNDGSSINDTGSSGAVKRSGGLGSIMDALSTKKTKIGCLDKSKVDWDAFVEKEGLKEELATFNRGKNGFVEKQMFLERADLRRFELEKGAREKTRKPHM
ncbi:craniofacial development protein 1 [Lepeophtheirus salmonis]|uniref:craniofacial development protein 1 n=1 Tax=Lepeophtheirus salmonis TaxID=72036 RepID=UPI001AE7B49F|nr:craniofacial development protein 1-like [Lepeophtheirus salmonis]